MKNDGGLTVGQEATYECNDGYNLIGEFKRICQLNSTWSGDEPMCTAAGTHRIAFLLIIVCCLFVALRPKSTAMVIAGRSVHLITLFPGQA